MNLSHDATRDELVAAARSVQERCRVRRADVEALVDAGLAGLLRVRRVAAALGCSVEDLSPSATWWDPATYRTGQNGEVTLLVLHPRGWTLRRGVPWQQSSAVHLTLEAPRG